MRGGRDGLSGLSGFFISSADLVRRRSLEPSIKSEYRQEREYGMEKEVCVSTGYDPSVGGYEAHGTSRLP